LAGRALIADDTDEFVADSPTRTRVCWWRASTSRRSMNTGSVRGALRGLVELV